MFKPNAKKMDIESLDELIAKCEDAMVSPFKTKKAAIAIEIKPGDGMRDGEGAGDTDDESAEGEEGESKPDLSDMDMDDLLRLYEEIKDKKAE